MKAFGDASFFRAFNMLLSECGQASAAATWSHRGVQWSKHRHSFSSDLYGFAIETFRVSKPAPKAWLLLVVKEFWWGPDGATYRSNQWAKPLTPNKLDIKRWIELEQARQANGAP